MRFRTCAIRNAKNSAKCLVEIDKDEPTMMLPSLSQVSLAALQIEAKRGEMWGMKWLVQ
jgi:Ni,Fe-hydrogenase III component G